MHVHMHANMGPGKTELMLLGALPLLAWQA